MLQGKAMHKQVMESKLVGRQSVTTYRENKELLARHGCGVDAGHVYGEHRVNSLTKLHLLLRISCMYNHA